MNTDSGNLYAIRQGQDAAPEVRVHSGGGNDRDNPASALMELARSLRVVHRADEQPSSRGCIIVISPEPSRYDALDFERIDVEWVLLTSPVEALDHLVNRGHQCRAVLTEVDLHARENGYHVLDALRANGFDGPVFLVVHREPLAADKAFARRRGATDILVFRSVRMIQVLEETVAGPARGASLPAASGGSGRLVYPTWLPEVVKQLARYLGPTAGDVVRRRYVDMHARYRVAPGRMDLVEEVADTLSEWPDDKARFISACNRAATGDDR